MPVPDQLRVFLGQKPGKGFLGSATQWAAAASVAAVYRGLPLVSGTAQPPDLPARAGCHIDRLQADIFGGMPLFDEFRVCHQKVVSGGRLWHDGTVDSWG